MSIVTLGNGAGQLVGCGVGHHWLCSIWPMLIPHTAAGGQDPNFAPRCVCVCACVQFQHGLCPSGLPPFARGTPLLLHSPFPSTWNAPAATTWADPLGEKGEQSKPQNPARVFKFKFLQVLHPARHLPMHCTKATSPACRTSSCSWSLQAEQEGHWHAWHGPPWLWNRLAAGATCVCVCV